MPLPTLTPSGHRLSTWNIPHLIFTSPSLWLLAISCVPLLHWCINERSNVNCYLTHLHALLYPTMWDHATDNDVNSFLQFFTIILSISSWSFVPHLPFLNPFCSQGTEFVFSRCSFNSWAKMHVSKLQIKGWQVICLKLDTKFPFRISFIKSRVFPVTIHLGKLFSWRHLSN